MWNLVVVLFCLTVAVGVTVLFWSTGIGVVFALFFVGTIALGIGSSIRQGLRK